MALSWMDSVLKPANFSFTDWWLSSFSERLTVLSVSNEQLLLYLATSLVYIPVLLAAAHAFYRKTEL